MIGTAEAMTAGEIEKPASHEIISTDLVALKAERRRFERRVAFWIERVGRLEGKGAPPP
jgi:hypothetical protein